MGSYQCISTFDSYVEQFKIYLDTIEPGGALIYNQDDEVLKELVESSDAPVKRFPIHTLTSLRGPHLLKHWRVICRFKYLESTT